MPIAAESSQTQHIGGDFDDFLRKESLLDDAEATAAKRAIAFQIAQEMKRARPPSRRWRIA